MTTAVSPALARGTWWRRIRLFVLLGILLLLLAHVIADLLAGRRVDAAVVRLEQRLGPLAVERLTAPPVPAADNRARLVRAAAALTVPATREAMTGITALGSPRETVPVPESARAFIEANKAALDLTADFGARQKSNWEVDYLTEANMPSLLEIRTLGNLIMLSALLELEAGRVDEAARHLANGLAMSASMRQEPILITQLIRIAVVSRQIDGVQRLVTQFNPSRGALEMIAARLAENRVPSPLSVGLAGEVVFGNSRFAALEAGRADGLSSLPRLVWSNKLLARAARPIARLQRAAYLERMEMILDSQAGPRPRAALPEERSFLSHSWLGLTVGLERALMTGDDHDSELAAAETAVALRLYKLDRGEYPADLAALAPTYLATVPLDPFTGRPPVYVREGTGFTLTTQRYGQRASEARPTPAWQVK